VDAR
jgi:hypothetical protein